jgi:hypothetical protein
MEKDNETDKQALKIFVPDDHATLPEAIAAASERWREISSGKSDDIKVPCIVVRAGEYGWQGTLQVRFLSDHARFGMNLCVCLFFLSSLARLSSSDARTWLLAGTRAIMAALFRLETYACMTALLRLDTDAWMNAQVKPGTMLHIEGEEGARVRGHWWMHAGTGGVIRGIQCACEGSHVMTMYGGCWLLERCELRCCAGSGGPHGMRVWCIYMVVSGMSGE